MADAGDPREEEDQMPAVDRLPFLDDPAKLRHRLRHFPSDQESRPPTHTLNVLDRQFCETADLIPFRELGIQMTGELVAARVPNETNGDSAWKVDVLQPLLYPPSTREAGEHDRVPLR